MKFMEFIGSKWKTLNAVAFLCRISDSPLVSPKSEKCYNFSLKIIFMHSFTLRALLSLSLCHYLRAWIRYRYLNLRFLISFRHANIVGFPVSSALNDIIRMHWMQVNESKCTDFIIMPRVDVIPIAMLSATNETYRKPQRTATTSKWRQPTPNARNLYCLILTFANARAAILDHANIPVVNMGISFGENEKWRSLWKYKTHVTYKSTFIPTFYTRFCLHGNRTFL